MHVLFFLLAFLSLFPAAAGWFDVNTFLDLRAATVKRVEAADAKLKKFKFDAHGRVPADQRAAFESALDDVKSETAFLRDLNGSLGHAELYAFGGTGGFVVFLVLGIVLGRKKPQVGGAQPGQPRPGMPGGAPGYSHPYPAPVAQGGAPGYSHPYPAPVAQGGTPGYAQPYPPGGAPGYGPPPQAPVAPGPPQGYAHAHPGAQGAPPYAPGPAPQGYPQDPHGRGGPQGSSGQ